jgi:AraC-like DNA-binding protein
MACVAFVSRPPAPHLAPFATFLWYFEGSDLAPGRELVVPTGAPQLLVNLHEDRLEHWAVPERRAAHGGRAAAPRRAAAEAAAAASEGHVVVAGAALIGPRARPEILDPAGQRRMTGVALRAGAASLLTGAPAAASEGRMVDFEAFAPRTRLRELMLEADEPEQILSLWEHFLETRLSRPPQPQVRWALEQLDRGARVGNVAAELGWSMPRLRAAFAAEVGLGPKRWARVRRVQRVLRALEEQGVTSWAELALHAGYADQAHLAREFREITGVPPTAYRPRRPGERNHIALD